MPSRYNLPQELDISTDEDFSKDRLDRAFAYIIQRLLILDSFRPGFEDQINLLRETGLTRLNEALQPIYNSLVEIGQIGIMFTATSVTPAVLGTGIKTFKVREIDRPRFAAAAYLAVQDTTIVENTMFGLLQSYDRTTGLVTILVDQFVGPEGSTGTEWRISAAASPNVLTTAHQVGAYTIGEVDKKIADLAGPLDLKANRLSPIFTGIPRAPTAPAGTNNDQIATAAFVQAAISTLQNFITNGASDALNQFNELANAIGNDPNFAGTMLGGLANRVRFDAAQGLTDQQKSQALANINAQYNLGFYPVQQGGGLGQNANKVAIGWGWDGALRATIDGGFDAGRIWTDHVATASLGDNGYQKLPSGLLIQWGSAPATADQYIGFPIAFPTRALNVQATAKSNTDFSSANSIYAHEYGDSSDRQRNGFACRVRNTGTGSGAASDVAFFAVGI
jgi:hypothetical protein